MFKKYSKRILEVIRIVKNVYTIFKNTKYIHNNNNNQPRKEVFKIFKNGTGF